MTDKEKHAAVEIRTHLLMWMQGAYPSDLCLASAPVIHEWRVRWVFTTSGETDMRLEGSVTGHPTMCDGDQIRTSEVKLLDRRTRWARTSNTLYRLGDHEGIEIPAEGIWT